MEEIFTQYLPRDGSWNVLVGTGFIKNLVPWVGMDILSFPDFHYSKLTKILEQTASLTTNYRNWVLVFSEEDLRTESNFYFLQMIHEVVGCIAKLGPKTIWIGTPVPTPQGFQRNMAKILDLNREIADWISHPAVIERLRSVKVNLRMCPLLPSFFDSLGNYQATKFNSDGQTLSVQNTGSIPSGIETIAMKIRSLFSSQSILEMKGISGFLIPSINKFRKTYLSEINPDHSNQQFFNETIQIQPLANPMLVNGYDNLELTRSTRDVYSPYGDWTLVPRRRMYTPVDEEHEKSSVLFSQKFEMEKLTFSSAQQAYIFGKSIAFGQNGLATMILHIENSEILNNLEQTLGTSPYWENKKFNLMYYVQEAKYQQSAQFRRELQNRMIGLEIKYALPNIESYWCAEDRNGEWSGMNHLGQILTAIRDYPPVTIC